MVNQLECYNPRQDNLVQITDYYIILHKMLFWGLFQHTGSYKQGDT